MSINDPEVPKVSRYVFGTFLSDGHILETTDAKKILGPRVRY